MIIKNDKQQMKKRFQLRIYGKVQGVWYRASTRKKAEELALSGFVRNEADGSVYAEVEGPEEMLKQMVTWCEQGPPQANVREVKVQEVNLLNDKGFTIRR